MIVFTRLTAAVAAMLICTTGLSATAMADVRQVAENLLTAEGRLPLRVKVAPGLLYQGRIIINIADLAEAERFLFAEEKDGRIKRLFIVQFEEAYPASDLIYHWSIRNPVRLGDNVYHFNTWYYDGEQNIRENPGKEGDLTEQFLRQKGLELPGELMMARWAALPTEDLRTEIILFYLEPMEASGFTLADFEEGGQAADRREEFDAALVARAMAAFEILPNRADDMNQ